VPGRKGMIYEGENWVDNDATAHRGVDKCVEVFENSDPENS